MKTKNLPDSLFAIILTIFAPVQAAALAVFAIVIIDLITGVLAARKRKEEITSARIRDSVSKLFIYEIALLSALLLENYLLSGMVPAIKIVSAVIGVAEGKSVLENLDTLQGGNMFKNLIDKLGSSNK